MVKDVAFIISQAIEPVEKGVNKIQETFHHISLGPENEKEPKIEFDEHITENVVDGKCSMVSSDTRVEAENLRR